MAFIQPRCVPLGGQRVKERAKAARPGVRARVDRGTAILVEHMRSQFRVFGEALAGVGEQVASGFEQIRQRFDGVDREIGLLKSAVLENIRDIRDGLQRLDEKKVEREEIDAIVRRVVGVHIPG